MNRGRTIIGAVAAALTLFLLAFEIETRPEFALPRDIERPDPAQESRFAACFEARDAEIHERAFETIDNPDVQKEFIAMHREEAERDCRAAHPRQLVVVRQPFRFNLVDIALRFRPDGADQGR